MLDRFSATPLYQQVADNIRQKISSGEYQTGQSLPSEIKCCETYQVSRVTIRNAISELVEQGLLVRKHGKGTFVKKQKIPSNLSSFCGFTSTCRENNIQVRTQVLELRKKAASLADRRTLQLDEHEMIIYLKRLRYADNHPVIIEHVHLPYEKYKFLLNCNMENRSLYETIAENTGANPEEYCYAEITLEASSATGEEAYLLDTETGKPLFILEEAIMSNNGEPIHWTKQIIAGSYFKFYLSSKQNRLEINLE